MKATTSHNYRHRLTLVMEYIYQNLDGDLDVNTLAEVAMMSPYHFHRIYRELAQDTVNATVRRLRLQRAAVELIRSEQPLADIAKKVAYGSLEAFSRAFTKQFGQTPSEYRVAKKRRTPADELSFVAMLPTEKKVYDDMFTVEIMNLDAMDVAAYFHQGDYMEIGLVFEKLFVYASSQNLLSENTRSLGLYYDDPKSVPLNTLRSKACITVAKSDELLGDDAPEKMNTPAGRYATVLFKGSYAELEKPYDWLFGEWLPNSGYEAADFPPMEEYLNDPKTTPPHELLTRIHCLLAEPV